jgi:type I restriction enzyme S subunit
MKQMETVKNDVGMRWEMVRLGDVATFVNGYPFKPTDWGIEGYKIIRIQNLTNGNSESNYFSGNIPEKYKVIDGDVLISWSATLDIFVWKSNDAWLNQHIFKVVFDKIVIDKSYFIYAIKNILDAMRKQVHGATMQHITKGKFDNLQIPLPPLPIQKRIAEILDAADALKRKDQELLKKYDELAQAIFIDMFGDPVKNEKGWEVKKLGDLIKSIQAGSSYNGEDKKLDEDEFGVLKVSAVTLGKFRSDQYKAVKKSSITKDQIFVQKGDFLFSRANTRELVGATCIVDHDYNHLFLPDKIWKINFKNEECNITFIKSVLSQKSIRYELNKTATGTSGSMLNISMEKLKNLSVVIPPINIQNNYEKMYSSLQKVQDLSGDASINSNDLFQALIQKAFKGELVA